MFVMFLRILVADTKVIFRYDFVAPLTSIEIIFTNYNFIYIVLITFAIGTN